ncbi:MAG TPA: peptidoglycan-binding domain-containing protein [Candidatus Binatia bacterium]|nr:peptidoglycan-binding domain-containing protein [Candidatus Binatia bacterium]
MKGFPLLHVLINLFCVGFSTKKDAGMALAFVSHKNATEIFFKKGEQMKRKKPVVAAIILSGAVGFASSPLWSQELPGERRQSAPNQTRPGRDQDVPGVNQLGTPELSKNDMRAVEEALQTKGYKPGKIDGVADDEAREAIRAFQKDNGFSVTGMVDQKTADRLGVRISSKSGGSSTGGTSGRSGAGSDSKMTKPGDDPPTGTRKY